VGPAHASPGPRSVPLLGGVLAAAAALVPSSDRLLLLSLNFFLGHCFLGCSNHLCGYSGDNGPLRGLLEEVLRPGGKLLHCPGVLCQLALYPGWEAGEELPPEPEVRLRRVQPLHLHQQFAGALSAQGQ